MFVIEKPTNADCKTLVHGKNVFHEAIAGKEERYHVKDAEYGDYDIVYIENESLNPPMPVYKNMKRIPDYLYYDETQTESLLLDLYRLFKKLSCEEVNEYTIVIAKVLIQQLDYDVYFTDKAILRFIKSEKLHIVDIYPCRYIVFFSSASSAKAPALKYFPSISRLNLPTFSSVKITLMP